MEPVQLADILMEIANNFINVSLEHADEVINKSLGTLGRFTQTDRAYVFNYDLENQTCNNTHEWCASGIEPQIDQLQNVPLGEITDWVNTHFAGNKMVIPDVMALEPESRLRQVLEMQDIKSLITLPMMDGAVCTGFVGFDSVTDYHTYSEKEQKLLQLFALMLVNLNNRINTQTQLNQAIAKAEAANQAKSEFLANMSHEIRSPLHGVIGFTDLLRNTELSSVQKQYVEHANASAVLLLGIINDILDFSKIEAGMMGLDMVRTDVRAVIQRAVNLFRLPAKNKGLQLQMSMDVDIPKYVVIDPLRLQQILTNLLSNAVKFTHRGEVELRAHFEAVEGKRGRLLFEVRDTGIGITDEQKERLFRAFSQADTSTTRKYGGTGLGLIISDMIAGLMGSKIRIDNSSSSGTTFYFELMVEIGEEDKEERASFVPVDDVDGRPSIPYKILIAEDVEMNRLMINAQIKLLYPHAEVALAENGKEVVEKYREALPDLVLMDLHMPEMDGIEATRIIRQIEGAGSERTPIIALTADAFVQQKERCLDAGMDEFLTKPLDSSKLDSALKRFLKA